MSDVKSRITNVIETIQGDEVTYFTLEGLMIGGFRGGNRFTPEVTEPKKETNKGGIVKPQTPHQVKRLQEREAESFNTPENRLKHLKEDVA